MDFDLIQDLKKNEQAYLQAKELESPLQVLRGCFDADDLGFLDDLRREAYSVEKNLRYRQGGGKKDRPSDIMAWPEPELALQLERLLLSKLPSEFAQGLKFEFAFHKNYHPYGLHTDAGYHSDEVIYKQGIIPLEVFPEGAKSHTVIMKQRCYFSSSFPALCQYRGDQRPFVDQMKEKWLGGFDSARPFEGQDLASYWPADDFHRDWLRGFEIDHAFEWKIGDMAVWDRSQIHCSSDFEKFGLTYKVGLMWVSSKLAP